MIGRIQDRATFAGFSRGRRASCGPVRVRYVASTDGPAPSGTRVAYALNRKVGTAVVRNRIRRRLRAALVGIDRADPHRLPAGAYLFSADSALTDLPFAEVERLVGCVVDRVAARA